MAKPEEIAVCGKIYTLMLQCSEVAQSAPHSVLRGVSGRWPRVRLFGL